MILPADKLDVGNCVILNEFDRPCGYLVAVITEVLDDHYYCKYLSEETSLDTYNNANGKLGLRVPKGYNQFPTPVEDFGVRVVYDEKNRLYSCVRFGESKARYPDDSIRHWQENFPFIHPARKSIVDMIKFS
jgi:hypothetical protein